MNLIVDNLAVRYMDEGEGSVVLMVHGWGSNLEAYSDLAQELRTRFRVLRVDLPGFGGSQRPNESWGIDAYASFLRHFLQKCKVAKLTAVIGHSMGGQCAIRAVGKGELSPAFLILLGAHGVRSPHSMRSRAFWVSAKLGRLIMAGLPAHIRMRLRGFLYRRIGSDYAQAGDMADIYKRVIAQDVREDAARVDVPSLLIYGAEDADAPPRIGQTFASLIPSAQLEIIEGAGHYVHHDKPKRVQQLIKDFLK